MAGVSRGTIVAGMVARLDRQVERLIPVVADALKACRSKTEELDRVERRIGTWLDGRRVSLPGSGYNNPSIWRFAREPGSRIDAGWTDIGMNNPGGWPEAGA